MTDEDDCDDDHDSVDLLIQLESIFIVANTRNRRVLDSWVFPYKVFKVEIVSKDKEDFIIDDFDFRCHGE